MREDGRVWYGDRWRTPEYIERHRALSRERIKANPEKRRARSAVWNKANPEKRRANHTAWNKANPDKVKLIRKGSSLRHYYGLTVEDYNAALILQQNACATCSKGFSLLIVSCVDHCHNTGVARGLLCHRCNLDIAVFERHQVYPPTFQEYLRCPPFRKLGIHAVGQKFKKTLGGATP